MSKLIYIIDDEENIRELITKYLVKEGYTIKAFVSGDTVIKEMKKEKPDMIILDIMMPGINGFELCKEVRKENNVPIIFVSARDEEFDRVLGIELGGDDYLSKPFSPRELVVRVKAIFRRIEPVQENKNTISLKDIKVYKDERRVLMDKDDIEFTNKEYDLLLYLMENKNRVYTREQLLNGVWGYDYIGDERAIDDLIKRVRKKLSEKGSLLEIKTVWGYGYKLSDQDQEKQS
jgi:DNA-binding response OmpR family regulator